MRPPCELVVKYLLPQIRSRIARYLIEEEKWKPADVAKALGVTPASILKYRKIILQNKFFDEDILDNFSSDLAFKIAKNELSDEEFLRNLCKFCLDLRVYGETCKIHRKITPSLANCKICSKIYEFSIKLTTEKEKILSNIKEALNIAKRFEEKVLKYIPEVRTNIVMAKENASSINDVAAFPGRITIVKNKLAVFSEPEFGASKFLSKVLLEIMKKNPKIKALTCIKYLENMEKSLVKLGIKYTILSKPLRKDTIWILEEEFNGYEEVLIDKGGLGIEPVMYILGVNAIEVVKKAVKIISEYEKIPKYAL